MATNDAQNKNCFVVSEWLALGEAAELLMQVMRSIPEKRWHMEDHTARQEGAHPTHGRLGLQVSGTLQSLISELCSIADRDAMTHGYIKADTMYEIVRRILSAIVILELENEDDE